MNRALLTVLIVANLVLAIMGSVAWGLLYREASELGELVRSINVDRNQRTIIIQELLQKDIDIERRLNVLEAR